MMKKTILTFVLLCCSAATAAEPATILPAPGNRFTLPLEDGTAVQAAFLPGVNSNMSLVYATRTGVLVILDVSTPGPVPPPPPPPPPPPAKLLKVAIVHDPALSTPEQRKIMADPAWRVNIPKPHQFCGIIPQNYKDPNTGTTPQAQARFLDAGKGCALPCIILLNESDKPVAVEQLPKSATAILTLIKKHGGNNIDKANNRRKQLQPSTSGKTGQARPHRSLCQGWLLAA